MLRMMMTMGSLSKPERMLDHGIFNRSSPRKPSWFSNECK